MREFKAVVLGAGGVGKSALAVRFIHDEFVEVYDPTIDEAYRRPVTVDDELFMIEVLDTAGAEQYITLNEMYIRTGRGFILVFSLTQEASLREIETLRQQIYRIKGEDSRVPIILVGTKLDLNLEREVPLSTIQEISARWDVPYFETSAKRNWHVQEAFLALVRQMRDRYPPEPPRMKKKKVRQTCMVM
ncbi:rap 1A [Amylostereum chailletii]|nr:rap 1A [Amylostereum chailletii]